MRMRLTSSGWNEHAETLSQRSGSRLSCHIATSPGVYEGSPPDQKDPRSEGSLTTVRRNDVVKAKRSPKQRKPASTAKRKSDGAAAIEHAPAGAFAAAAEKPNAKKTSKQPETAEERKARKNAYVREWRKAHKDEYAAYMKEWRAKRDAKAGKTTSTKKRSASASRRPKEKEANGPSEPTASLGSATSPETAAASAAEFVAE